MKLYPSRPCLWIAVYLTATASSAANAQMALPTRLLGEYPGIKHYSLAPSRFAPLLETPPGAFTAVPEGGRTFLVGQSIPLLLTVTNTYGAVLWLYHREDGTGDVWTDYGYRVQRRGTGAALKDVPMTAFGRSLLVPAPLPGGETTIGSVRGFALEPGHWDKHRILISRLFDMSARGTYVIHITRQGVSPFPTATFDIEAPATIVDVQKAPR